MEIARPDDTAAHLFAAVRPDGLGPDTRITVRPSDTCFVFQAGQVLGELAGGTHGFTPAEQPFLASAAPGPLDLVFVTVAPVGGLKFGTATPIPIRDPNAAEPVRVRLLGSYSVQVNDPQKLAGTALAGEDGTALQDRIRTQLLMALGSAVGQEAATGVLTAASLDRGLIALAPQVAEQASLALADTGVRVAGVETLEAHAQDPAERKAAPPASAPGDAGGAPAKKGKGVYILAGCLLSLALGGLAASLITVVALILSATM